MPYDTISVKGLLQAVNAWDQTVSPSETGWYLPDVQRQYVWGSRYEAEKYICKLFDSIFRGYPIGSFLIWNTNNAVAFRRFADHYRDDMYESIEDEGAWPRPKQLIYDGQQRIQTIYSGLLFSLNDKVLCFDVGVALGRKEDVPFTLRGRSDGTTRDATVIPMVALYNFSRADDFADWACAQTSFPKQVEAPDTKRVLAELWGRFAGAGYTLSYFKTDVEDSDEMQELFERVNTGGIPLTQIDLMFSRVKNQGPDYARFEEDILQFCRDPDANGGWFEPSEILQILLLTMGKGIQPKIDSLAETDLKKLKEHFNDACRSAITDLTRGFLKQLHLVDPHVMVTKRGLLPLAVLFMSLKEKSHLEYAGYPDVLKLAIKQYLVLAQLLSWDLQSIVKAASELFMSLDADGESFRSRDKPHVDSAETLIVELAEIVGGRRRTALSADDFDRHSTFALGILTERDVAYNPGSARPRPELDHIFPKNLLDPQRGDRKDLIDSVWNLQPVPGKDNNRKRDADPKAFFALHPDARSLYDFLPADGCYTPPNDFIAGRRSLMLAKFRDEFGLEVANWTEGV